MRRTELFELDDGPLGIEVWIVRDRMTRVAL